MTKRNGRHGKKFNRGSWAVGVPASGGFYPEQGVVFYSKDPLGNAGESTYFDSFDTRRSSRPSKRLMKRRAKRRVNGE